jgi:hypothetical protein
VRSHRSLRSVVLLPIGGDKSASLSRPWFGEFTTGEQIFKAPISEIRSERRLPKDGKG